MRLIQIYDNEFINLDAVVTAHVTNSSVRLSFSDSTTRHFFGDHVPALAEIITKNSTNLNDLVELRRKQKEAREVPDEVLLAGVK